MMSVEEFTGMTVLDILVSESLTDLYKTIVNQKINRI